MNFQVLEESNDNIRYVIVSTGHENNMFNHKPSNLTRFNLKNRCKCLFVYIDKNIYIADYDKNKWSKNTSISEKYNLVSSIHKHLDNKKSFIVFELTFDQNYEDAFFLLSNIRDLDICNIWTCNFVDFKSLRQNHNAVYASYESQ